MKTLDEEYMKLLAQLVEEQYEDALDDYDVEQMEWVPTEPDYKKVTALQVIDSIDLTKVSSNDLYKKIKPEIAKYNNLRVGEFKIRLTDFHGVRRTHDSNLCVDLHITECRSHTPSGMKCGPGGMDYPLEIWKDSRFNNKEWMKYCSKFSGCFNSVPVDIIIDIVRWMQIINKLPAFL